MSTTLVSLRLAGKRYPHDTRPWCRAKKKSLKVTDFDSKWDDQRSLPTLSTSFSQTSSLAALALVQSNGAANFIGMFPKNGRVFQILECARLTLQESEQYIGATNVCMFSPASKALWISWRAFFVQYSTFFYTHAREDWVRAGGAHKERCQPFQQVPRMSQVEGRQPHYQQRKCWRERRRQLKQASPNIFPPRHSIAKRTKRSSHYGTPRDPCINSIPSTSFKRELSGSKTVPVFKSEVKLT